MIDDRPDGCPHFVCECPESCPEPLPPLDESLAPGESWAKRQKNGDCCPVMDRICNPDQCPNPPECSKHFVIVKDKKNGDCCPKFSCQHPYGCLYSSTNNVTNQEEVLYEVYSDWRDGDCKKCICLPGKDENSHPLAECQVETCDTEALIGFDDDYVMEQVRDAGHCCPKANRVACKRDGQIFQVGEEVASSLDSCVKYRCGLDSNNNVLKETLTETCDSNCALGFEYVKNGSQCCGHCEQRSCLLEVDNVSRLIGVNEEFTSDDGCITYMCFNLTGTLQVVKNEPICPDVSDCPSEQLAPDVSGCCQVCMPISQAQHKCDVSRIEGSESVGLVVIEREFHGVCSNREPIQGFQECLGHCQSGTFHAKESSGEVVSNRCRCCRMISSKMVEVSLVCEDGFVFEKQVEVADACDCLDCNNNENNNNNNEDNEIKGYY